MRQTTQPVYILFIFIRFDVGELISDCQKAMFLESGYRNIQASPALPSRGWSLQISRHFLTTCIGCQDLPCPLLANLGYNRIPCSATPAEAQFQVIQNNIRLKKEVKPLVQRAYNILDTASLYSDNFNVGESLIEGRNHMRLIM